jgi:hypothetical protein
MDINPFWTAILDQEHGRNDLSAVRGASEKVGLAVAVNLDLV